MESIALHALVAVRLLVAFLVAACLVGVLVVWISAMSADLGSSSEAKAFRAGWDDGWHKGYESGKVAGARREAASWLDSKD